MPPLRRWERISEASFRRYAGGGSAVRIEKLLQLIPARSRILDVGIGHGYIGGVLLRELRPSHYCGVELRESFAASTREMIAANDLGDLGAEVVVRDIFDLDPAFWRRHNPEFVLMLEMLEHVEDPGAALATVAAGVRPGTTIVFTVPLRGRLDSVWGHRSVFDGRRLMRLCRQAGLRVERAQPLQSTWSLVVARSVGAEPVAAGPEPGYTFRRVPVPAGDGPGGEVRLRMPSPRAIRLDLSFEPPDGARRLWVRGLDDSGGAQLEWVGDGSDPTLGQRATYLLRPGKRAGALAPVRGRNPRRVTWIEVSAEPRSGAELTLVLHRAAYLGTET